MAENEKIYVSCFEKINISFEVAFLLLSIFIFKGVIET